MYLRKKISIVFLAAGVLALGFALVYGKLTYTSKTHKANLGSVEISVKEEHTVSVPIWVGLGLLGIGGVMFLYKRKNKS